MAHTLRRRRRWALLAALVLLAVCPEFSCDDGDPAKFDGQTAGEWVAQAKNGKSSNRIEALRALRAFPSDKDAVAFMNRTVSDDAASFPERLVAAQSLYRATGKTDKIVPAVGRAIRQQADAATAGEFATKDLEELVFWLGANARPLIPDIEYARSKANPRLGPGPAATRAQLDRILQSIPSKT